MLHPSKLFGRLGNNLFQWAYIFAENKRGNIPDIYLQDPKYFDEYREELIDLFRTNKIFNRVAIHVRRKDYVDNPFYVDLMTTDYYKKAMALFPNEKFIVFSDDITWCEEQEIFQECEFAYGTEWEDFDKMASCKAFIIANSSFSWWAAYLSKSNKIVAPKEWYTDKIERTICPKEWIRV